MTKPSPEPELIPPSTTEKLHVHTKLIKSYIKGHRKGAAEQFAYAFLAGQKLLEAKTVVAHGNAGGANAGFKLWVEKTFPEISHRTATNWMCFAECIIAYVVEQKTVDAGVLDFGSGKPRKLNVKSRSSILDLVLTVMDGKGMMEFMRSSGLLRDALKPDPEPRKPLSKQEATHARLEQANRMWKSIEDDLKTGWKVMDRLKLDKCQQMVDLCVETANKFRERIKQLEGSAA